MTKGSRWHRVAGLPRSTENTMPDSLLQPDDPPAFASHNETGRFPLLLTCDHAGNAVPRGLAGLGLPGSELGRHIGWDIGALDVAIRLSELLDAPLLASGHSRLAIDCNRTPGGPGSIPRVSDGTTVPANVGLSPGAAKARADNLFWPYHRAIAATLDAFAARGVAPAVLAIHSCTPVMAGHARPWQVGVVWKADARLPSPLLAELRASPGFFVGDNEPYSGRAGTGYTLTAHAEPRGLPHASVEIRQDLIGTKSSALAWADRLAPLFGRAVEASRRA